MTTPAPTPVVIPMHELKTWPVSFRAIWRGDKPFEVRQNDRGFCASHMLHLREFDPCTTCNATGQVRNEALMGERETCPACKGEKGRYTGSCMAASVTYVMEGGRFGVAEGFVVMGIKVANRTTCSLTGQRHS